MPECMNECKYCVRVKKHEINFNIYIPCHPTLHKINVNIQTRTLRSLFKEIDLEEKEYFDS